MSRILLIFLFVIWMAGPPTASTRESWPNLVLFFSFYLALVLVLGLWSRMLARRVAADNFHRSLRLFNKVMFGARVLIPVWFSIGVWGLGWGSLVAIFGAGLYRSAPGMLVGTLPAFATWMGLWWSQYPAERALREQNLLVELDNDLPLYRPPPFRSYFISNLRLQVLFTIVPVAMIVLARDLLLWGAAAVTRQPWNNGEPPPLVELGSSLVGAATVFLFVPALLAKVLNTSPMPDSPLRRRLDEMCRRAGVRYRQILVWDTNNHVGNAAVMGVLPWIRYVLLSDVLLERMNDREIESVFAHELGHIVHRHMTWYAVFFVILALGGIALGTLFSYDRDNSALGGAVSALGVVAFVVLFGALSRRCERQADVYAARMMEMLHSDPTTVPSENLLAARQLVTVGAGPLIPPRSAFDTAVGQFGATAFSGALRRVAVINNIQIERQREAAPGFWNRAANFADNLLDLANNWLHGSISSRMRYVEHLGTDPRLTIEFDRMMTFLYFALLFALFLSAVLSVALGAFNH